MRRIVPILCCALTGWLVASLGCGGDEDPPVRTPATDAAPSDATPTPAALTNVVLITLDTTRADALGAYGQARPITPQIDRMAAEGVRFDQVSSAAPTTLPSHATILTGKLPFAHGVRSNHGYALGDAQETLAERLKDNGFATAAEISAPVIGRRTRLDQGFDSYRDTASPMIRKKVLRMAGDKVVVGPVETDVPIEAVDLEERTATDISDRGIEFIRAHRKQKFFLWLHYFDPHAFYLPPPEFRAQIPDDPYLAEVSYVDDQIGRVLDQLRGLALEADTLVVLTADHGESRDEHGENTHSYFVYDSTLRVPLVMWGPPQLGRAKTIDSPVRTADIVPTVLDLLGLTPMNDIQGTSLRPLIDGTTSDLGLTGYGETIEVAALGASMLRFVRQGRWKYIHKVNPELYDIDADPGELTNRAAEHPQVVDELRGRLERLVASVDAPDGSRVAVTPEARAQLEALGYLATGASSERQDSFTSTEVTGIDPLDLKDDILLVGRALRAAKRKQYAEAENAYLELWTRHGVGYFGAQRADALVELGRVDEAIDQLDAVIAADPETPDYRSQQGGLLILTGQLERAEEHLRVAYAVDPCDATAAALLAHAAFLQARYREQHETLRASVEDCAEQPAMLNNYAYALATSTDESLRDGRRAIELARRATELDEKANPGHIDTLAVAYAESGDFDSAVAKANEAIRLASTDAPASVSELEAHLALFTTQQPLRDPSP